MALLPPADLQPCFVTRTKPNITWREANCDMNSFVPDETPVANWNGWRPVMAIPPMVLDRLAAQGLLKHEKHDETTEPLGQGQPLAPTTDLETEPVNKGSRWRLRPRTRPSRRPQCKTHRVNVPLLVGVWAGYGVKRDIGTLWKRFLDAQHRVQEMYREDPEVLLFKEGGERPCRPDRKEPPGYAKRLDDIVGLMKKFDGEYRLAIWQPWSTAKGEGDLQLCQRWFWVQKLRSTDTDVLCHAQMQGNFDTRDAVPTGADWENPVSSFIVPAIDGNGYYVRQAIIISLAELFAQVGQVATAKDLLDGYLLGPVVVSRKKRLSSSQNKLRLESLDRSDLVIPRVDEAPPWRRCQPMAASVFGSWHWQSSGAGYASASSSCGQPLAATVPTLCDEVPPWRNVQTNAAKLVHNSDVESRADCARQKRSVTLVPYSDLGPKDQPVAVSRSPSPPGSIERSNELGGQSTPLAAASRSPSRRRSRSRNPSTSSRRSPSHRPAALKPKIKKRTLQDGEISLSDSFEEEQASHSEPDWSS